MVKTDSSPHVASRVFGTKDEAVAFAHDLVKVNKQFWDDDFDGADYVVIHVPFGDSETVDVQISIGEIKGSGDQSGLDGVDPDTHPSSDAIHFRRIIAAREALEAAEKELRDAVAAARAAGDSWTSIGAAMGTTRQGAYQRFGKVEAAR